MRPESGNKRLAGKIFQIADCIFFGQWPATLSYLSTVSLCCGTNCLIRWSGCGGLDRVVQEVGRDISLVENESLPGAYTHWLHVIAVKLYIAV